MPDGSPILIGIGRQSYEKGFDLLIDAFSEVLKRHADAKLVLVGEGHRTPELKSRAGELGIARSVTFLGFQENPYKYLRRADLFISPSRYEGFSNVLVEALTSGVPAVVTDCPSANREVIEEGSNGWFAQTENVGSLAETINKAIAVRKMIDSDEIRRKCISRFSIDEILPQYERAIEG